jgi:hypothetical protein
MRHPAAMRNLIICSLIGLSLPAAAGAEAAAAAAAQSAEAVRRDGQHDFESFNGRTILVRNIWSDITADSCRFEQSFSDDGGKTWEVNWIAVDTRAKKENS